MTRPNYPDFVFCVQPFGVVPQWVLEFISETIETEFSSPCRTILPTLLPPWIRKKEHISYYDSDVLAYLGEKLPKDASRIIGVLPDGDLHDDQSPLLGGAGSLFYGTAVVTLWHLTDKTVYIPEGLAEFKRNLRRVVLHELGHTFANHHCHEANCLMDAEFLYTYENPAFCEACQRRISLGLGAGPALLRFALGLSFYRKGDFIRAVEFFREAVKLSPVERVSWFYLGHAYWRLGKAKKAEKCFCRALNRRSLPKTFFYE